MPHFPRSIYWTHLCLRATCVQVMLAECINYAGARAYRAIRFSVSVSELICLCIRAVSHCVLTFIHPKSSVLPPLNLQLLLNDLSCQTLKSPSFELWSSQVCVWEGVVSLSKCFFSVRLWGTQFLVSVNLCLCHFHSGVNALTCSLGKINTNREVAAYNKGIIHSRFLHPTPPFMVTISQFLFCFLSFILQTHMVNIHILMTHYNPL